MTSVSSPVAENPEGTNPEGVCRASPRRAQWCAPFFRSSAPAEV